MAVSKITADSVQKKELEGEVEEKRAQVLRLAASEPGRLQSGLRPEAGCPASVPSRGNFLFCPEISPESRGPVEAGSP